MQNHVPVNERFIVVGVCAMSRKANSKPMMEILHRLIEWQYIKVEVFPENTILYEPIEKWPLVDALISFYSKGFPIEKALAYAELVKPFLVNDLHSQCQLMDRSKVYKMLQENDVPVPRYAILLRDKNGSLQPNNTFVEHDDIIEINGEVFQKPFVEKPINAEDHNINIYFPSSAGGGHQQLFRKVADRSSRYSSKSNVRQDGSYIYENFMATDGTDVKVYSVFGDYAHAEARKSPALDGRVERDAEGKEIRYPIILTAREKVMAKRVCDTFKQQVCGFDLLRTNNLSFVCDVNGFSFVKSSKKYYDDCGYIVGVNLLRFLAPHLPNLTLDLPRPIDDQPMVRTTVGRMMELRCVLAVIRHGDRTPKQKLKIDVRHPRFFQLFEQFGGGPAEVQHKYVKLKKPKDLQQVLDVLREVLLSDTLSLDMQSDFMQAKQVLEMYGHFSGINRKVQIKYQPLGAPLSHGGSEKDLSVVLNENAKAEDEGPSLLLILKWGGELTKAGREQAQQLGQAFRNIYPGGDGVYGKDKGLGLLRLHSTYRHDLKIYASDEGRVQMTAAAFARGFLALDGELTPILVQMVKSANTDGLLDSVNDCRKYQSYVKAKIRDVMNHQGNWTKEHQNLLAPTGSASLLRAISFVGDPRVTCGEVHRLLGKLLCRFRHIAERRRAQRLYHNETWDLMLRRWEKLYKDFAPKLSQRDVFDYTKVPDIYDNIKYDLQHNAEVLELGIEGGELFVYAKHLADIVVPQEYGLTKDEKLYIALRVCTPLLRKLLVDAHYTDNAELCTRLHAEELLKEYSYHHYDLPSSDRYSKGVTTPHRFVRTRLYFTSESHIHSLMTALRYGGLSDVMSDGQWARAMDYYGKVSELNYLSQIVIMVYEDPNMPENSEERFHVELHFSPGAYTIMQPGPQPPRSGYRPRRFDCAQQEDRSHATTKEVATVLVNDLVAVAACEPRLLAPSSGGAPHRSNTKFSVKNVSNSEVLKKQCSLDAASEDSDTQRKARAGSAAATEVAEDFVNLKRALLHDESNRLLSKKNRSRKTSCSAELARNNNSATQEHHFLNVNAARNEEESNEIANYATYHGCLDVLKRFAKECNVKEFSKVQSTTQLFSTALINSNSSMTRSDSDLHYDDLAHSSEDWTNLGSLQISVTNFESNDKNSASLPCLDNEVAAATLQVPIRASNPPMSGSCSPTPLGGWVPDTNKLSPMTSGTAPSVAEVHPLETLHNSLTLNQLTSFLEKMVNVNVQADVPWITSQSSTSPVLKYDAAENGFRYDNNTFRGVEVLSAAATATTTVQ